MYGCDGCDHVGCDGRWSRIGSAPESAPGVLIARTIPIEGRARKARLHVWRGTHSPGGHATHEGACCDPEEQPVSGLAVGQIRRETGRKAECLLRFHGGPQWTLLYPTGGEIPTTPRVRATRTRPGTPPGRAHGGMLHVSARE